MLLCWPKLALTMKKKCKNTGSTSVFSKKNQPNMMALGWGRFWWLTYISFDFLWWLHELYVTNCHIKQSFYWWLDKRNWCIVGYKRNASWAVVGTFLLAHWNSSDRSTVNGLPWHLSRYSSHVCYNTDSTKGYLFMKHPFIYRSLIGSSHCTASQYSAIPKHRVLLTWTNQKIHHNFSVFEYMKIAQNYAEVSLPSPHSI